MSRSIVPNDWNGGDKKNKTKGKCRKNLGEWQPTLKLACCYSAILSSWHTVLLPIHTRVAQESFGWCQISSIGLKCSNWRKPSSVAAESKYGGGLSTVWGEILRQWLLFARDAHRNELVLACLTAEDSGPEWINTDCVQHKNSVKVAKVHVTTSERNTVDY